MQEDKKYITYEFLNLKKKRLFLDILSLTDFFCILPWIARNFRDQKQWEICCVTAQCVNFNHTCLIITSITKNMQKLERERKKKPYSNRNIQES